MKKTTFLTSILAVALLLGSCSDKQHFNIIGETDNDAFEGKTVYLYPATAQTATDSTVVTNGKFSFSGEVEQGSEYVAHLVVEGRSVATCIVEYGNIKVDIDDGEVDGTALNIQLNKFYDELDLDDYQKELEGLYADYRTAPTPATRAEAERLYDSVEAVMNNNIRANARELYSRNPHNILGAYAVSLIADMYDITYAELCELLDGAEPIITDYEPIAKTMARLECVEKTSVGKHYTDIQGVDGKLSDLIDDKLALVDFYASWCGPCRAEIKDNLVPLWKKYQKKGLVIVGLNVWERGDAEARNAAHEKVMADLGITYPQLVDSTRTATNLYGVRGIPQILLIGPDGTILARDLRGAAIEEAIVKAIGK